MRRETLGAAATARSLARALGAAATARSLARALAVLGLALVACERSDEAPAPAVAPAAAPEPPPDPRASFVGAARCAECHAAQAEAWRGSHHDLAMQEASEATVLGEFRDAELADAAVSARFTRRDGGFWVTLDGADGRPSDFEVKYTFGVDPLQQYLVELPGGRLQVLPLAWDVRAGRWIALPAEGNPRPGDPFHWTGRYQSWNAMCAECHSTDLRKGYDEASDTYHTTWAEIDVACEACHGPGAAHVAWAQAGGATPGGAGGGGTGTAGGAGGGGTGTAGGAKGGGTSAAEGAGGASAGTAGGAGDAVADGLAVHFDAAHPRAEIDACAPCHSRRSHARAEPVHGGAFLDGYMPTLLREPIYHADGQIREEDYEWGSFLQSRMHAMGVRCSDCHDPHSLRLRAEGNALCTRCHSQTPDARFPSLRAKRYDAPEHHHHAPGSEGARCVECHMPTRTYMAVDARRDHSLRIPRPDLSEKLHAPDACTTCHAGRKPAWAAGAIAKWFGPDRRRERHWGEVIASVRAREPGSAAELVALVRDRSRPAIVRATAAELLPLAGAEGREALLEAASDPEDLVRVGAAHALDALPLELRLEPAERLISDPVGSVRIEAARSLGPLATDFFGPRARHALLEALADYEALQHAEADLAPAHHNLALVAEAGGDPTTAEREYRRALELDPGFQPARVNLATLLNRTGRNDEAEALLREALARQPDDGELYYSLGLLLAEVGRMEDAEAALAEATRRLPGRARVRYNHALALQKLGRSDEATAEMLAALAAAPEDPDLLRALVSLYAQAGRWQEALPHARELARIEPNERSRELLLRVEDEASRR